MTDEELNECIRKTSQGNKEAFHTLYEYSRDHVFRTVSFLVSNKNDVCDVVNEVYTEMFKSLLSYNFQKSFRAWLNGLIVRQTQNWNRKIWRRFRLNDRNRLLKVEESPPNTEQIYIKKEHADELMSLLQKLSSKHRFVIVLRYFHECTFEEISDLLGIPVGTVKSRHHTALGKLRSKAKFAWNDKEEGNKICPLKIN